MVPLPSDVLEEGEHVDVSPGLDLPHHGVQHDVAAGATDAGAARDRKKHQKNHFLTLSYTFLFPSLHELRKLWVTTEKKILSFLK